MGQVSVTVIPPMCHIHSSIQSPTHQQNMILETNTPMSSRCISRYQHTLHTFRREKGRRMFPQNARTLRAGYIVAYPTKLQHEPSQLWKTSNFTQLQTMKSLNTVIGMTVLPFNWHAQQALPQPPAFCTLYVYRYR